MAIKDIIAFPLHPHRWQHRRPGHVLPFRIPFFRIFYSTTYTTLFILVIILLAITPASMIWTAIEHNAFQYIFMISGCYALTVIIVIFVYSSRIWTNRRSLAEVGKAYIPIEDGELGKSVRKLVKKRLDSSCIVAWESRPRDLEGEIMRAEKDGILPDEGSTVGSFGRNSYMVGTLINIDPSFPPWGNIMHDGWSSPSSRQANTNPHIEYADVIAELPNLLEARAVSLAPIDPLATPTETVDGSIGMADPVVVEVLRRPETMGMRDYITQLAYLGLINPPELGQRFLMLFETSRFSGRPISQRLFDETMTAFSLLLDHMTELAPEFVEQIRLQSGVGTDIDVDNFKMQPKKKQESSPGRSASRSTSPSGSIIHYSTPPRSEGNSADFHTPVTARTAPSKFVTPVQSSSPLPSASSEESLKSVVRTPPLPPRATPSRLILSPKSVHSGRDLRADSSRSETSIRQITNPEHSVVERHGDDMEASNAQVDKTESSSLSSAADSASLAASETGSVVIRSPNHWGE